MGKVIVTGSTGLVGSHLLVQLVKNKTKVIALKRESSNVELVEKIFDWYGIPKTELIEHITWKNVNLSDTFGLLEIIEPDAYVYHCAAQVSFDKEHKGTLMETNFKGTANLVNVCLEKKIKKLCYVSSVATLSINKGETQINENSFWKTSGNESVYAQSKYLAEMEVWRGIEEGLCAVMVNPSIIIGPHDFTKGSAKMIETSAKGLRFYTKGSTGFVDASDVATVMISLMNSNIESQRYLLNSANVTFKEFFANAAKQLNKNPPSIIVHAWMSGLAWRIEKIRSFFTGNNPLITKETSMAAMNKKYYDSKKIESAINFKFKSIDEILSNACRFYLREQQIINKNLNRH